MTLTALLTLLLATLPASPRQAADSPEVVRFITAVAPPMMGLMVGGGKKGDKILYVGKNDRELLVVGIEVRPLDGGWGAAPPEPGRTLAVLRTRPKLDRESVSAADLAFAKTTGLPVFVMADRGRQMIREIADRDGKVMVRDIAADGSASPWREP